MLINAFIAGVLTETAVKSRKESYKESSLRDEQIQKIINIVQSQIVKDASEGKSECIFSFKNYENNAEQISVIRNVIFVLRANGYDVYNEQYEQLKDISESGLTCIVSWNRLTVPH